MKNKWVNLVVILLLLLMLGLEITSAQQKSQTYDEAVHILAGYSYLKERDYRWDSEHPPLTKYLAGFPLLFLSPEIDTSSAQWQAADQWNYAPVFLYNNTVSADTLLFWARFPMMLLSLALGWLIFVFAKKLFGWRAGLLALILYVFSPNILAHARLANSDLALAFFFLLTFYCLYNYLEIPKTKNLILLSVSFGLALLTKFSAPIIFPIIILLFFIKWVKDKKTFPLPKVILSIFTVLMIGIFFLWAGYGFEIGRIADDPVVQQRMAGVEQLFPLFNKPIPATHYFIGISRVLLHSVSGHGTYLLGQHSNYGWWYYFPMAFLLKTPITTILLVVILKVVGLFWLFKKRKDRFRQIPIHYYILIFPPLIYFLYSMLSNMNLGLRHILLIYPFILILIGSLINWSILKKKIWQGVLVALMAFYLFSSINIYPDYLAYFNEAVGGPQKGPEYLLDSNLDWGQDLVGLRNYLADNDIEQIYLNYSGSALPDYYVDFKPIPDQAVVESETFSGYLAVSVGNLYGLDNYFVWLKKYQPVARVGYSIYVYQF